jgi:hypothetical protein
MRERLSNIRYIIVFLILPFTAKAAITIVPLTKTIFCAGDSFFLQYTASPAYGSGNTFFAQLSNASGSFAVSTIIGNASTTTSGTIACAIPGGTPTGSGYRVRIYATNPADTSLPNAVNIQISQYPVAGIASNNNPCVGDTLRVFANDTNTSVTYSWTGPVSFTASTKNASRVNAQLIHSGGYTVTISRNGCAVQSTTTVTVKPLPIVNATSNSPICEGDTLKLFVNTTPSAIYAWIGPTFSSSNQNPTIPKADDSANTGIYTVTVTSNGCSAIDTVHVLVKQRPLVPIAAVNLPVCIGRTMSFTGTVFNTGLTYSWSGPVLSSTLQNPFVPAVTSAATGIYTFTVTLNGCDAFDTVAVTVNNTPAKPTAVSNDPCQGDTLKLTASGSTGNYTWYNTTGFSATSASGVAERLNALMSYAGTYFVFATSAVGCVSDTQSVNVNINLKPVVPTVAQKGPICVGQTLVLTQGSTTAGVTYSWIGPGGFTSTGQNVTRPDASAGMSGIYQANAALGACIASATTSVTVRAYVTPSVSISADPDAVLDTNVTIIFSAGAINAGSNPTYQWRRNGVNISGATSYLYYAVTGREVNDGDEISVKVTSSDMCPRPDTVISYIFIVRVEPGISNTGKINKVIVYPNPVHGKFTIKGTVSTDKEVQFKVINVIGQVIYKNVVTPDKRNILCSVNIGPVAEGIYILMMQVDEQVLSVPFLAGE